MNKLLGMVAVAALLAACADEVAEDPIDLGGTPVDPADPTMETPQGLTSGDIDAAAFNATAQTMVVSITLDGDVVDQPYVRNATYDAAGYQAYTLQDDPLDRHFTAFGATSSDGATTAVLAMDGGQFNRYFGGAIFGTSGYTAPAGGLASYAGQYVGLTNISTRDGTLASGAPVDLLPERAIRTTGSVFINADFADGQVNGAIYNRVALDGGTFATPTLVLIPTAIGADGTFGGTVEGNDLTALGSYSGLFGGTNATAVAGGVYITDFDDVIDGEEERGIFVLNQCGTAGASVICDTFNVDDINE